MTPSSSPPANAIGIDRSPPSTTAASEPSTTNVMMRVLQLEDRRDEHAAEAGEHHRHRPGERRRPRRVHAA